MQKDKTTEEKIIDAAKQVFLEKGMAGARMQDIADKAGINKAMLHYYFRNKEKLFEIIFNEAASKFIPKVHEVFTQSNDLFVVIRHFVAVYITTLGENPYLAPFIAHEVNQDPQRMVRRMEALKSNPTPFIALIELYQKALTEKKIKPIAPEMLFINTMSLCAFPFIAKPVLKILFSKSEEEYNLFIERRKVEVAEFIIHAIKSE